MTPNPTKSHQDEIVYQNEENHTKMQLITPRYETTPNQTKSHWNEKLTKAKKNHTKIQLIAPRYKMRPRPTKSHQDENFNQDVEKSCQDSRDRHEVMTSSITWPDIRIISHKVIKSLQEKESHTNTQKLDQDIKFTPRRTWPPWSNVICPSGWPCGRMLWSAHIPLANEQGLWISLSYQNSHYQNVLKPASPCKIE